MQLHWPVEVLTMLAFFIAGRLGAEVVPGARSPKP